MKKSKEIGKHKMSTYNPLDIVVFINSAYPHLRGKCEYCPNKKKLISKDENYYFHFDPFHGVLGLYELN